MNEDLSNRFYIVENYLNLLLREREIRNACPSLGTNDLEVLYLGAHEEAVDENINVPILCTNHEDGHP